LAKKETKGGKKKKRIVLKTITGKGRPKFRTFPNTNGAQRVRLVQRKKKTLRKERPRTKEKGGRVLDEKKKPASALEAVHPKKEAPRKKPKEKIKRSNLQIEPKGSNSVMNTLPPRELCGRKEGNTTQNGVSGHTETNLGQTNHPPERNLRRQT